MKYRSLHRFSHFGQFAFRKSIKNTTYKFKFIIPNSEFKNLSEHRVRHIMHERIVHQRRQRLCNRATSTRVLVFANTYRLFAKYTLSSFSFDIGENDSSLARSCCVG